MMYQHYIFGPEQLGEALGTINENGEKIVGSFYLTDTNQVTIITEAAGKKPFDIADMMRRMRDEA